MKMKEFRQASKPVRSNEKEYGTAVNMPQAYCPQKHGEQVRRQESGATSQGETGPRSCDAYHSLNSLP